MGEWVGGWVREGGSERASEIPQSRVYGYLWKNNNNLEE